MVSPIVAQGQSLGVKTVVRGCACVLSRDRTVAVTVDLCVLFDQSVPFDPSVPSARAGRGARTSNRSASSALVGVRAARSVFAAVVAAPSGSVADAFAVFVVETAVASSASSVLADVRHVQAAASVHAGFAASDWDDEALPAARQPRLLIPGPVRFAGAVVSRAPAHAFARANSDASKPANGATSASHPSPLLIPPPARSAVVGS